MDENNIVKCSLCGEILEYLFKCRHCEKTYCMNHRFPEDHGCTYTIGTTENEVIGNDKPIKICEHLNTSIIEMEIENDLETNEKIGKIAETVKCNSCLAIFTKEGDWDRLKALENEKITIEVILHVGLHRKFPLDQLSGDCRIDGLKINFELKKFSSMKFKIQKKLSMQDLAFSFPIIALNWFNEILIKNAIPEKYLIKGVILDGILETAHFTVNYKLEDVIIGSVEYYSPNYLVDY